MNMTGATKNKLEIWILDKCKICGSPVHQHEFFYLYSKNKVVYRKAFYCYSHSVFSFQRTESISKYVVLRRSYQNSRLSIHHWTSSSCRDRIVASPSWRTSLKKWKSLIEVSRRFEMCNRELLKDEKSFQNRKTEEILRFSSTRLGKYWCCCKELRPSSWRSACVFKFFFLSGKAMQLSLFLWEKSVDEDFPSDDQLRLNVFNPFTPKISLVILLIVCHTALMALVQRI